MQHYHFNVWEPISITLKCRAHVLYYLQYLAAKYS